MSAGDWQQTDGNMVADRVWIFAGRAALDGPASAPPSSVSKRPRQAVEAAAVVVDAGSPTPVKATAIGKFRRLVRAAPETQAEVGSPFLWISPSEAIFPALKLLQIGWDFRQAELASGFWGSAQYKIDRPWYITWDGWLWSSASMISPDGHAWQGLVILWTRQIRSYSDLWPIMTNCQHLFGYSFQAHQVTYLKKQTLHWQDSRNGILVAVKFY
jgi:hypothetical protein